MKAYVLAFSILVVNTCFAQGFQPESWLKKKKDNTIQIENISKTLNDNTLMTKDSSRLLIVRNAENSKLIFIKQNKNNTFTFIDTVFRDNIIEEDSIMLSFITDGSLQSTVTGSNQGSIPAEVSLGLSFRRLYPTEKWFKALFISMAFSVASSVKPLQANYSSSPNETATNIKDFASSILIPINGPIQGQGIFINSRLVFNKARYRPIRVYQTRIHRGKYAEKTPPEKIKQFLVYHDSLSNKSFNEIMFFSGDKDSTNVAKEKSKFLKLYWYRIARKYFSTNDLFVPSFDIQLGISNREWKIRDVLYGDSLVSKSSSLFYLRTGPSVDLLSFDKVKDDFSIRFGLYYTLRYIAGDLSQDRETANRVLLLGSEKRLFMGFEPAIEIIIKNLRISASVPIIFQRPEVAGLTGGRFLIGAGLTIGTPPIRFN